MDDSRPSATGTTTSRYLNLTETKALLSAPDRSSWFGRRDHALLLVADPDRAARLRTHDLRMQRRHARRRAAHLNVTGKGRKRRTVTFTRESRAVLQAMAQRTPGPARGPAVPDPPRHARSAATPSSFSLAKHTALRRSAAPRSPSKTRHTARAASHQRDAAQMPTMSTSPRSHCGSDTRASRPPRSTSTPTPS